MLVPYRRPKRSVLLPVVATLAVAAPLVTLTVRESPSYQPAGDSDLAAVPAELAEVALSSAPDVVLPLSTLTGLNLPDLHLSDLRTLPLPESIPVPPGLPAPPGVQLPSEIPLPELGDRPSATSTPTPTPTPYSGPVTPQAPAPAAPATSTPAAPATSAPAPGTAAPEAPASPAPAESGTAAPTTSSPAAPAQAAPASTPRSGPQFVAARLDPAQIPGADPSAPALQALPPDMADDVGADVKELTRDTPFSMVALTAKEMVDSTSLIRAQQGDGNWGPWFPAQKVDTGRDDHTAAPDRVGTEPIYVGETKAVQILTTHKPGPTPAAAPAQGDPAQDAADKLAAVLINPGRGAIDEKLNSIATPVAAGGPKVVSRAQWGADESLRCEEPTYDDGLGGITVHHTAGRNDYSRAESAGIVRAIYAYHAKTLGWCDIGYNALVDKYGQIFEGRYGGLDKPVQGAHAGGFNENTSGVAMMGDFETEPPTDAQLEATGKFIGWRAKTAGLDPEGHTRMYSEGTDFTSHPKGEAVDLPVVFAHRDVGNTTCPGDAAYALMDKIRGIAAGVAGSPAPEKRPQTDLAALATLTKKVLSMVDKNIIAKYWAAQGGPDGRLGAAATEPTPTANGGQYAKFVNGYVYADQNGSVVELAGQLLDRFAQLGGATGALGAPLRNPYPVPGGERADFALGSLVLNTATGIVTTMLKHGDPQQGPAGDPIPEALPAPEGGPQPAGPDATPQPGAAVAPAPEGQAAPTAGTPAPAEAAPTEPGRTPVEATPPAPAPAAPADPADPSPAAPAPGEPAPAPAAPAPAGP